MEVKVNKFESFKNILELAILLLCLCFFTDSLFTLRTMLQNLDQQGVFNCALILFRLLICIKYVSHWLVRPWQVQ